MLKEGTRGGAERRTYKNAVKKWGHLKEGGKTRSGSGLSEDSREFPPNSPMHREQTCYCKRG